MVGVLIDKYYEYYQYMQRIPVKIVFTYDLWKTHFKYRPDHKERLMNEGHKSQSEDNGRMILPNKFEDEIYVLLNLKKVEEYTKDKSMAWIGTMAHELTHAIDYYQMARKESLEKYDLLEETSSYLPFQLWSEYHARKLGYGFLRRILEVDVDSCTEKDRIKYIVDTEWPFHMKSFLDEYHKTSNGNVQMYLTMQLLGRYSVWCDLFPDDFNEKVFTTTFENNPWFHHLFSFIRKHETLDAIYNHFGDFQLILQENWETI